MVVGPDGRFGYPFSEPIQARGMTLERIAAALRGAFVNIREHDHNIAEPTPLVTATVVRRSATHYRVAGNVFAPTDYWCDEPRTAARAIQLAGGRDFSSSNATPFILREGVNGQFDRIDFDPAAVDGGPLIQPFDVVYVP